VIRRLDSASIVKHIPVARDVFGKPGKKRDNFRG